MTLGSFLDLGISQKYLEDELSKLNLSQFDLEVKKVSKSGIGATSVTVNANKCDEFRHLPHIEDLIKNSYLSEQVKELSINAFYHMAHAEAKVHQTTIDKIHFHEVGAIDAIVDIVGSMICYVKLLEEEGSLRVVSSPLPLGSGFVKCEHGILPVPAPATAELTKGFPVKGHYANGELVTPTGAVILKTLQASFSHVIPEMTICRIGYGAGKKNFEHPNLLRLFIGEEKYSKSGFNSSSNFEKDQVTVVETNLDDCTPECISYAMEQLFAKKALDVYFTPIYMKKNRPSTKLTVICYEDDINHILEVIFRETSSIGIRKYNCERRKLRREMHTVNVRGFKIQVKVGSLEGSPINIAPEYEDCARAARELKIPLEQIYTEAIKLWKY